MKKLLLAQTTLAILATSTFASEDSKFYLRTDISRDILTKAGSGIKLTSNDTSDISAGIGYIVTDNLRTELAYAHYFSPTRKGYPYAKVASGDNVNTNITDFDSADILDADGKSLANSNASMKTKAKLQTLMLKGYYDIAKVGITKLFLGGGLGIAKVQEKESISYGKVSFPPNYESTGDEGTIAERVLSNNNLADRSMKLKTKNNFSWLIAAGAGFEVTDNITFDIQYNYQDFGKTSRLSNKTQKANNRSYRMHSIKAGVRLDI